MLEKLFASFSCRARIFGPNWARKLTMYLPDKDLIEQSKIALMENQFLAIVQWNTIRWNFARKPVIDPIVPFFFTFFLLLPENSTFQDCPNHWTTTTIALPWDLSCSSYNASVTIEGSCTKFSFMQISLFFYYSNSTVTSRTYANLHL